MRSSKQINSRIYGIEREARGRKETGKETEKRETEGIENTIQKWRE